MAEIEGLSEEQIRDFERLAAKTMKEIIRHGSDQETIELLQEAVTVLLAERKPQQAQAATDRATINRLDNEAQQHSKTIKGLGETLEFRTFQFKTAEGQLNRQIDKTHYAWGRLSRLKGFCVVHDQSRLALAAFENDVTDDGNGVLDGDGGDSNSNVLV
jgi:outer membrane PBP1 activator LpoA protein